MGLCKITIQYQQEKYYWNGTQLIACSFFLLDLDLDLDLPSLKRTWTRTRTCSLKVDLDLDLDLRIVDLDLDLDFIVAGLVTSLMLRPRDHTGVEPKFWPRPRPWPQQLGLGLASVLLTWPRKCAIQCKMILVVSISWLYQCKCNSHYKDVVKHSNVGIHLCSWRYRHVHVLIQKYLHVAGLNLGLASKTWPRPRGSRLDVLASSFNITVCSPYQHVT